MPDFEDNFETEVEEVVVEAPKAKPAPVVAEVKSEGLAPLPKLTTEELKAPVAARAASIVNKLPGVVSPQSKVEFSGDSAAVARAKGIADKFLAARQLRNI